MGSAAYLRRTLTAGGAYFLAVFAIAFALGVVRVLLLAPRLGEVSAVAIELPIMLTVSWFISRRLVRQFNLTRIGDRILMGGIAFALLMSVEFVFGVVAFDRTPGQYFASMLTSVGILGFAGQCAFALLPILQWILSRHALSSRKREESHASRRTTQ